MWIAGTKVSPSPDCSEVVSRRVFMATTITSYPSALSLAGNIAPVRVTASETFRFKLSKGDSVLLEEDYTPDASGSAEIDIRDIILSDLSLSLPSSDVFCQSAAAASYTISAGVDSKTFTGVLCGLDRPATDAATFLLANFLTWQPQIKAVQYNQPEWLSFFVSSAQTSLKVRFYKKDGTTADVVVADSRSFDPNRVYSVNMQFARIWALGDGDRYGMFDAWLEDDQGTKLTYTQRYVLDTSSDDRTLFVTRNSLGGLDTFVLHGSVELANEAEHTNVMRARLLAAGTIDWSRTYSVNTGLLSLHEAKWMQDLLRSQQSWVLLDGALRSIVLLSPSVTSSSIDDSSGTVDFMLCDDDGYLNIARTDVAPEAIEVPGPDGGEVFFLTPRLIEYPDASLEDSWLIPLQSGFEEKWYKASLGGIRSYVAGYLEDTYGRLWHGHDNLAVLDKFGIDASGALTWNGNPVGSGTNAGDFVTLATDQTITGRKRFDADAVFATKLYVPSTAGAGVYDVFIDDNGAVSGEIPSAGGEGLDIDAMWSELASDDASRAIHLSHIPLIPWGNISGRPTTLQGYGLQTEADNRYVRQVTGMGLSSNDYTDGEKEKLSGIAVGAQVNILESVKLNGSLLQVTSKAVNVNAVTSLSVPTGLSAGDMTSAGRISVSLASGYVIPKNTAKFWGRTWNGLDDVSGAIEGATDIDASGTVYAATAIRTNKLYVPSSSGNNVYDIYVDDSGTVSGEVPAAGEGLDIDAMWEELATDDASRVIALSHIPMIPWGNVSGIPSTFTPASHTHPLSQISDLHSSWDALLKAAPSAYVTRWPAWSEVTGKPDTFTPASHSHPISQLSDLGSTWDAYLKAGIYERSLTFNGTTYPVFCDVSGASVVKWYAPVAAGTAGQWLKATGGVPVWANDGSGSGLNADLLDGKHNGSVSAADAQWLKELAQIGTDYTTVKAGKDRLAELISSQGGGIGYPIRIGASFISQWDDEDASTYASSVYEVIKIGGGYSGSTYGQWLLSSYNLTNIGVVGRSNNAWSTIKWLAFTTDNVASATKLQTARTLWGRSFDGTANVSGAMTDVGNITFTEGERIMSDSGYDNLYIKLQDGTVPLAAYNTHISRGSGYPNVSLGTSDRRWAGVYSVLGNFSGLVTASSGVQIGSTSDYGWYLSNSRLVAGQGVARGVNVGSLLISSAWADYTKVPTNGLYCKGDIWTGGKLYIPASAGNQVYDLYIDDTGTVSGEAPAAGEGGIDIDAMWEELAADDASRTIHLSHIPLIPWDNVSGKPSTFTPSAHTHYSLATEGDNRSKNTTPDDYDNAFAFRGLKYNNIIGISGQGTYSYLLGLRGWTDKSGGNSWELAFNNGGIYARSGATDWGAWSRILTEANYPGTLDGRYIKDGENIGTAYIRGLQVNGSYWNVLSNVNSDITMFYAPQTPGSSGQILQSTAGTPTWVNPSSIATGFLYLNPNNGSHIAEDDALPSNGRFAVYDVNASATAGGSDGYIMSFRWPSGNWCTQLYIDVDPTGVMALRHRNSSSVWSDWYRILHSGNYSSYLDTRYLQAKDGTVLNGKYKIAELAYEVDGNRCGYIGFSAVDTPIFTNADHTRSFLLWHAGNDGSGSSLDADLLDGYHATSFLRNRVLGSTTDFNTIIDSGVYRISYTTSNGASNGPSGNEWGQMLVLHGSGDTIAQLSFGYLSSSRPKYRSGNPSSVGGSGSWSEWRTLATIDDNVASATNADMLDGTHKSGLLTSMTSTSTTNLSLTVGGTTKSVTNLYATYLDGLTGDGYMKLGRSVNAETDSTYSGYIPPLVMAMMRGEEQNADPEFASGVSVSLYNNKGDGSVTLTRVADSTAGNSSGYVVKVHSSATASPGGGGFTFQTSVVCTQTTCVIRAKIPSGYSLSFASNSVGSGGVQAIWLTSRAGTGKWEWYACSVYFGTSPSTSHFYYLSSAANVDWYVSYAQVFYNSSALYSGLMSQRTERLRTARTLWGRSFDGTASVSGAISSTGSITPSAGGSYNIGTSSLWYERIYGRYIDTASGYNLRLCTGGAEHISIQASNGYVGINNTSPAYQLDVAGSIYATSWLRTSGSTGWYSQTYGGGWYMTDTTWVRTYNSKSVYSSGQIRGASGLTISDDFGWFSSNSRLSAGLSTAKGVNVGSLLISSAWADYTKVPTNGIYCKGSILIGGTITGEQNVIAYSSSSRALKDIVWHSSYSEKLQSLGRVVDYRYNDILKRDKEIHTGLIYEFVKPVIPSMCYMYEGYGALNYLSPDYINLIAGAVQEHTSELTTLRNKVKALEDEISRLRRGLAA